MTIQRNTNKYKCGCECLDKHPLKKEKENENDFGPLLIEREPYCIYKSREDKTDKYGGCVYGTGETKKDDVSSCYLTTACTASINLPDNCLELRALRGFRDKILLPSSAGRKAVKEYYNIAPGIVSAVNASENPRQVWNKVYSDVRRAVTLVRKGKFNEAFEHYKGMTTALRDKYLN